jgi:hypothetical protein
VYAVWFNMYPGDARLKWPSKLLTDPRVLHFWDEQRVTGLRYMAQLPAILDRRAPDTMQPDADAMWDAFFVYAPGDAWQDPVPAPVLWGYPIMVTHDHLARLIEALAK